MGDRDDPCGDVESVVDSLAYYAPLLSCHDILLDRYYHSITRIIRPHLFYSWLREKQVFTRDDQEEVDNKFITTVLKAGSFNDNIPSNTFQYVLNHSPHHSIDREVVTQNFKIRENREVLTFF